MENDLTAEAPESGRLLGIDFGTKRVGVSVSTGDQKIASPLEIYERKSVDQDARYFRSLISDYQCVGFVVGLPLHVGGEESASSHKARQYGQWIHELTKLPVVYWDERYTSSVAEEFMIDVDLTRQQRKRRLDMVAAQVILQSFLNERLRRRQELERVQLEAEAIDDEDEQSFLDEEE